MGFAGTIRAVYTQAGIQKMRSERKTRKAKVDGNPLYRLFNLKSPKNEIKVSISSIRNKDILIDNLRMVGLY